MSRIRIELDTTDLSTHKDIALIKDMCGPYYNWAIKRVALIQPEHGEIDIKPKIHSRNTEGLIKLIQYLHQEFNFQPINIAGMMGLSEYEFNGRFGDYLKEDS